MLTGIHIGTSGWSYAHWRDIFYPEHLAGNELLPWYAKTFKVTEINTSFYHLPLVSTVEKWAGEVPARFKFCPKISRYITHVKRLLEPEETLPKFFDVFDHIHKRLGPVLIQLPPTLQFEQERAAHFFQILKDNYKDYTFALEARHESWLADEPMELLKKYRIAWVIAYSGKRWPAAEEVTAKDIYLRFHGPDGHFATSYTNKQIEGYAKKISDWQQQRHRIWAFFNNDGHGYAIKNALTLTDLLK
ncbi:uncharacterized protein YecE (DUF72 family) [Chitinophaga terrae (ex Kim and Jung 2007)]|uniref:DUF72 domain-containing protein n=1 Tax=Chitinophaga terrae (ex Kim and Jung 2007) TaxID=408074 RepID=UPI0027882911|nr:DUF72 domain-containing protein [Chitinophaga terrae (ex Kim and Jung 2007)]MDQ0108843.1 uncharacterized protein YecE (DUF72 family) [Chitinophaga terrae (ex Kim and Jung 2007)]